MSCRPTDLVYLTRSDRARDSFMVFFFLWGHTHTGALLANQLTHRTEPMEEL